MAQIKNAAIHGFALIVGAVAVFLFDPETHPGQAVICLIGYCATIAVLSVASSIYRRVVARNRGSDATT